MALSLMPPTTTANVDYWRRTNKVPPKWVLPVEKLAQENGIKVTRHEIRPDIFGEAA